MEAFSSHDYWEMVGEPALPEGSTPSDPGLWNE